MQAGKLMSRTILVTVCLLACGFCFSQDLSNKGRDFWITYPAHVDSNTSVMGIYITSDVAASGNVYAGGANIPFSIQANAVKTIFIGPNGNTGNAGVYLNKTDGITSNAAVHVTSGKPVVVYAHIIKAARSGASLILPSTVWGKEYIVPSYRSAGQSGPNSGLAAITVVAKDTNTVVEITPRALNVTGTRPAGAPYTITLAKPGDVYQVQYVKDADISGTLVKSVASGSSSCKPIGVFSSTTWSAFDCIAASGGDNLYQQLFPVRSFGKAFITAPFYNRNYDIIRVFVTDPSTVVTRKENGITTTLTGLQANSFYEFKTNLPNMIQADKPASVVQYITSQTCYSQVYPSDPEMVILSPVEQTINNITVFSAHQKFVPPAQSNVNQCYLNIIIKTSATASFTINGSAPKGSFKSIPGTAYSYLQEDVSALSASNPVQTLHADSSFSAIAYGYGNVESYGYNAGTNVRDLYQYIGIRNQYATVNFPATCVNTPFQFSITLPYKASKLVWQFGGQFPDVTVGNPSPDSSFIVDGKTLYRFRLPNTFSYPATGSFPVTVLATNPGSDGCNGEQEIVYDLQVFEKPRAKFTWAYTGCITDPVQFSDSSDALGNTVNRWTWQFGDNTGATTGNPVKTYSTAGSFTVKESIITDIGCLADTTAIINVSSIPVASFSVAAPYCSGSRLAIKDASVIAAGTITKWFWDYGDGTKDTLSNGSVFTHVFRPGTFTISLTVQSGSGCTSKAFTQTITVTEGPAVDFRLPAIVCLPKGNAAFTNLSTISNISTNPLSYLWNFGDGGTDTAASPVHIFKGTGPFDVKLTVTSKAGCVNDSSKNLVNVFAQPVAAFNLTPAICLRDSSYFTDASTAANQSITGYNWVKASGVTDTAKNTFTVFSAPGNYSIKHWVVSDKGCTSDTIIKQQLVNPLPSAAFVITGAACAGSPVTFTSQGVANAGSLNNWRWDMGDGTIKNLANGNAFQYVFGDTSPRIVKLVVNSSTGCISDTFSAGVNLHPLPSPNFGTPEICLKDAVARFTDSSLLSGAPAAFTYLWKFSDPGANAANPDTSHLKDPGHRYSATGNYQVILKVTTAQGCSQSVARTFTVNGDDPVADFDFVKNNICASDTLRIINRSSVGFGKITRTEIYWNWPSTLEKTVDEDPAPGKNYQYHFPDFAAPASKQVNIRLVAFTGGVCASEITKQATLQAKPIVVFREVPGFCPNGQPVQLTQASASGNLAGTGSYSGTGISPAGLFTPASAGTGNYVITYRFATTAGCTDSASQTVTVWPMPVASFAVSSPACENSAITFTDHSAAGAGKIKSWNWIFGDGNNAAFSNDDPFTKTYAATGNYNVQLQVTTDSGCTSNITSEALTVSPLPVAAFDMPAAACVNTPAAFVNRSTIAGNSSGQFVYQWQAGNSTVSSAKDASIVFASSGNFTISLYVTSKDGCRDTAISVLQNVLPQPLANFQEDKQQVCLGDTIQFTDLSNPLSQTIRSWHWNFDDGNASSQQNISHSWQAAGSYDVSLFYITGLGCYSDTMVKNIGIYPVPVVDAGPDLVILQGGQRTLLATVSGSSGYQYQWTPATALSNPAILQPAAFPAGDITYTLKVTGAGGCSATDEVSVKYVENPLIPNAFSPNGDGINDVWFIRYIDSYTDAAISVFDRYGRQVYTGKGSSAPWDGRLHGTVVPSGVYYYIINLKNGRRPFTGSLTILK